MDELDAAEVLLGSVKHLPCLICTPEMDDCDRCAGTKLILNPEYVEACKVLGFKIPLEPGFVARRAVSKSLNLGLAYGTGPAKLKGLEPAKLKLVGVDENGHPVTETIEVGDGPVVSKYRYRSLG